MKKYYNETTKEWYTEGRSMTRKVDGALFSGVPSEELLFSWGFREWIEPAPTPEQLLAKAKEEKIAELIEYDSSPAVNSFEIRNHGMKLTDYWLDRDLRTSLEGDVRAASKIGDTYRFDVRELGITLTLSCEKFLEALDSLRQYAYTAYNVTSQHMAAINALTTKEAVESYYFTTGFPQQLVFNAEDLLHHE